MTVNSTLTEKTQVKPLVTKKKIASRKLTWIPIAVALAIWEAFARYNLSAEMFNPKFLPPPSAVVMQMWEMTKTGVLVDGIIASTLRVVIGSIIGILLGVATALLIGNNKFFNFWLSPIFNVIGPIPALAILPLFIIWFGIGELPKIILIAWTVFFPVLTNTLEGLKSVNSTLVRSAMSLGASHFQIFKRVITPSILPNILAGCQISLGLAFSALVVSEMLGATAGLGYIIVDARNYFKIENMYVSIIVIGLEYTLFLSFFKWIERKLLSWRGEGLSGAIEK